MFFYSKYIEKAFEERYISHVFEKIEKYYYDNPKNHTNGEYDVVTYDSNGYVFISKVCFLVKEEIMLHL